MVSAETSSHTGRVMAAAASPSRRAQPDSNNDTGDSLASTDVHSMDFDLSEFAIQSSLDDLGLFTSASGSGDSSLSAHAQKSHISNAASSSDRPNAHAAPSQSQQASVTAAQSPSTPIGVPSPAESSRGPHSKSNTHSPAPHRRQRQPTQSNYQPMSSPAPGSSVHHPLSSVFSQQSDALAGEQHPAAASTLSSASSSSSSSARMDQSNTGPASNALQQFMSALEHRGQTTQASTSQQQQHPSAGTTPAPEFAGQPQQQLNLQDIQRLIAEKEQADRLQSLQTALLRQQLEAISRAQHNPQVIQQLPQHQQRDLMGSQSSVQQLLSLLQSSQVGGSNNSSNNNNQPMVNTQNAHQPHEAASQLSPDAHQLLSSLLEQQQQHQSHTGGIHQQQTGLPQQSSMQDSGINAATNTFSKLLSDTSFLAQYGLITPPASGALNIGGTSGPGRPHSGSLSHHQAPFMSPLDMPQGSQPHNMNSGMVRNHFSPRDSPAVTPASVFSNMSLGGMSTSTEQFFSPLTSPALHPQPPYYGNPLGGGLNSKPHKVKSTTPTASPLALTGKPGPLPRKNRSTTAEARANRARPSPLIKPTTGSVKRKKDASGTSNGHTAVGGASSSGPSSRRPSISEPSHSRSASQVQDHSSQPQQGTKSTSSYSTFTPVMAGVTKPMDASPSEGAVSTPSPIDLSVSSANAGKPMTPSSLMGIQAPALPQSGGDSGRQTSRLSKLGASSSTSSLSHTRHSSSTDASPDRANESKSERSKGAQVTFAPGAGEDEDEDGGETGANGGGGSMRRTSHKVAEQKRRDSLKYCFDELRGMLPPVTLAEDAPGGSFLGPDGLTEDEEAEGFDRADVMDPEYSRTANRAISKVALLRHSNEWIIRLRNRLARRDAALSAARSEVDQLRTMLLAHGIMLPTSGYGGQQHLAPPPPPPPPHAQPQPSHQYHFDADPAQHHHHDQHNHHMMVSSSSSQQHHMSQDGNDGSHSVGIGTQMDWH